MPSNEQQTPVLGTRITNPTVGYALCCALAGLVSVLPPGARAGALSLQTKTSGPFFAPSSMRRTPAQGTRITTYCAGYIGVSRPRWDKL